MIHRQNYLDVKAYLTHKQVVLQRSQKTIRRDWAHLRHVLEWCDEIPFPQAYELRSPVFPAYLVMQDLSVGSIKHGLSSTRAFFRFAATEWPQRYKKITPSWINTLVPPRHISNGELLPKRKIYTLDDMMRIADVVPTDLRETRAQAGACMLFISGMRPGALGSIPIYAVNVQSLTLQQLPSLGVKTKNGKAAITYMIPIARLLEIVSAWDAFVRVTLPEQALWYATLKRDKSAVTATFQAAEGRVQSIEDDLKILCKLAGIPYRSPHQLRHGHAVYGLKRSKDMKTFKAISQNLMHASITTTDTIYSRLLHDDIRDVITNL